MKASGPSGSRVPCSTGSLTLLELANGIALFEPRRAKLQPWRDSPMPPAAPPPDENFSDNFHAKIAAHHWQFCAAGFLGLA